MFILEIHTDNAAFGEDAMEKGEEICRLLSATCRAIRRGEYSGTLIDNNGNAIGFWTLDDD